MRHGDGFAEVVAPPTCHLPQCDVETYYTQLLKPANVAEHFIGLLLLQVGAVGRGAKLLDDAPEGGFSTVPAEKARAHVCFFIGVIVVRIVWVAVEELVRKLGMQGTLVVFVQQQVAKAINGEVLVTRFLEPSNKCSALAAEGLRVVVKRGS